MICLTGDVHHMSLKTGDQQVSHITEAETARRYVMLCEENNVFNTLYFTGRLFQEEWPDLESWIGSEYLEIGGHTFNAFEPSLFHRIWNKLTRNYNGPRFYEARDVGKTVEIIKRLTGQKITAWRNHCYFHGPNTNDILVSFGCTSCSDEVALPGARPRLEENGLLTIPINTIPDHEHIYHGERTKEQVDKWVKRYNWSDAYGSCSHSMSEWRKIMIANIEENESKGVTSVIIAHPLCMYLADGFDTLETILKLAQRYGSCTVTDLAKNHSKDARLAA